jgi:hypothetical protein
MTLHHDKDAFEELVTATSNELHIPTPIIEKDYYVTLVLKELSKRIPRMVFKGGTSLSKCFQIIDRFSEDIDISYTAEDGMPGESRKRYLKSAVVASMESLGLPITNLENTRSRRSYNSYHVNYPSIYESMLSIKPELIVETYVALLPFPTVIKPVENYIHLFLQKEHMEQLIYEYELEPFTITTQAIQRTLIDKVFALCGYFLTGKIDNHSRHIYDIHRILTSSLLPSDIPSLVHEVRLLREPLPSCPSASKDIDVNQVLGDIIDKAVYKKDYHAITEGLLFTPVSYETALSSLKEIIKKGYFMNATAMNSY